MKLKKLVRFSAVFMVLMCAASANVSAASQKKEVTTETVTEATTAKAGQKGSSKSGSSSLSKVTTEAATEVTTAAKKTGQTGSTKRRGSSSLSKNTTTETTTEAVTEKETFEETTTETTTQAIPVDALGVPLKGVDLAVYNIVAAAPENKWTPMYAVDWKENTAENNDYVLKQRDVTFENGDIFYMHRYTFKKNDEHPISTGLSIQGSRIEIRYLDANGNWYMSSNLENAAYETMYIDTDKESLIIGVPAVYMNDTTNQTLIRVPEQEKAVKITKEGDGYRLTYEFPRNTRVMGEIWVLRSKNKLADWTNAKHFAALKQDLSKERRFCWDGYYFPIPSNYKPFAENMLYRHPSNYVGASFVKNATLSLPAAKELGYVMTKICMENQNAQGYWQTGPQSEWLMADFAIDAGFYDTRFNTDFAENLLNAYKTYNDKQFLEALVRYGEFFKSHAQEHSYATQNGGILVEDYGHTKNHNPTHVSLNHQLAELNLLYKMYDATKHEPYLELADKMLLAIEDTKDQWVLPSNNLNYARHYTGTYNVMVDYPYLTYNDLYTTRHLLGIYFNKSNDTVQYLMDCKMQWMKANGVTGYYE
ncbi:MAG: hypothetical protein IJL89_07925 [Firmicutes bacterium]|nr:hypothetical protein [Bacillota bacterium]